MKVFGIGFHKTATKSLAKALTQLAYKTTGPNGIQDIHCEQDAWRVVEPLLNEFDAFQDNPWPLLFVALDQRYPGSKFILTQRPEQQWLASARAHFSGKTTPMREWIYGVGDPLGNESVFLARYRQHNQAVLEYFKERPNDLLVMHITEGDGWEKLCPFLNKKIPSVPFPSLNRKEQRLDR